MSKNKDEKNENHGLRDNMGENNKNIFMKIIDWCKRPFLHPTNWLCLLLFTLLFVIIFFHINRTPKLNIPRYCHSSVLLNDGRVLVTGGFVDISKNIMTNSVEIYNPKNKTFSLIQNMHARRANHFSVLLPDGKVLIIGGNKTGKNCEIFDPQNNTFSNFIDTNYIYKNASITKLPNGNFLLLGGSEKENSNDFMHNEIFNIKTNTFEKIPNLLFPLSSKINIVSLSEEYTLFARGWALNQDEILIKYNNISKNFCIQKLNIPNFYPWYSDTFLINKNKILIFTANGAKLSPIKYDLDTKIIEKTKEYIFARYSIVVIQRGEHLYLIGGIEPMGRIGGVDIYDIKENKFKKTKINYKSKYGHSATLLKNNKILIIGGYNPYSKNKINKLCQIL